MRKVYKRVAASALVMSMLLVLPAAGLTVKADSISEAAPEDVYVSFGADLKDDEKAKVMRFDIIVSFDSLSMKEMFNHVVEDVREAFPDYDVQVQFDIDISD